MDATRALIRLATRRSVMRRALATAAVVGLILTLVNHGGEVFGGRLRPDHAWPIAFTFLVPFAVATVSSIAAIRRHERGLGDDVIASQVEEVGTFPEANPNPVFRVGGAGDVLYLNPASAPLIQALGEGDARQLPGELLQRLRSAAEGAAGGGVDVEVAGRRYRLTAVAPAGFAFINVYGVEVTRSRAVEAPAA